MNRRIVALVAVLSLVVVAGCPKKDDKSGTGTGAVAASYKTPEEVFEASKAAMGKGDYVAFVGCMAPENIDKATTQFAGLCVMIPSMTAFDKSGKMAEKMKPLLDAAAKHGLTEEVLKNAPKVNPTAPREEQEKAIEALAANVKNKAAFVADIMGTVPAEQSKSMKEEVAQSTLKDLKVEGDTATATIVSKSRGKDKEEPVKFKKVDGSWRMMMNMK